MYHRYSDPHGSDLAKEFSLFLAFALFSFSFFFFFFPPSLSLTLPSHNPTHVVLMRPFRPVIVPTGTYVVGRGKGSTRTLPLPLSLLLIPCMQPCRVTMICRGALFSSRWLVLPQPPPSLSSHSHTLPVFVFRKLVAYLYGWRGFFFSLEFACFSNFFFFSKKKSK